MATKSMKQNHDFLKSVQNKVILKQSSPENLHSLLLLCNPKMTMKEVLNDSKRVQAMKKLMVEIHPNNFPYYADAQCIFEDIQRFYEMCSQTIATINMNEQDGGPKSIRKRRRRRNISPTSVVEMVVQFNIRQKWDFLTGYTRPQPPGPLTSGKVLAPLVAYQCINARGAIAHGKRPSLIYSWENAFSCVGLSVQEVLDKHGGYKTISGDVDKIKVELIHRGPVISFSFIPTKSFAAKYPNSILPSRIKKHHYCLIIGWKLTEFGEVWLVQSYHGNEIMYVPIGQLNIEETIIYPRDDLKSITWQHGPYFDRDMSDDNSWFESPELELHLSSIELEELALVFGGSIGVYQAIKEEVRFVIRDLKCSAHSRSCKLEEIIFDREERSWRIFCSFNDQGIHPLINES